MSANVVVRRIVATPARSASQAWAIMVTLLAPDTNSAARKELESIAGIASSLISDEAFLSAPAVMRAQGPRIRLYCLYNEDAISGDNASESALAMTPTDSDWKLSLPCSADDLSWVQAALKEKSSRITARDLTQTLNEDEDESQSKAVSRAVTISREAFLSS